MIGWIIFIIWIVSFVWGVISLLIYLISEREEEWALFSLIICLVIFLGIPLMIIVAIANGLTTAWTQWLQSL